MTAPPPPPSRLDLRTTTQLLKRTASSFSSTPFTFLLLSLLLFSFRTVVEDGTLILTAFIDRDPSLRALLSRLDIAGKNIPATLSSPPTVNPRHRRRPFLHLTRVGTLDDDFFSGDEYDDRTLFGGGRRTQINGSFLSLSRFDPKLGFSGSVEDNGIRASEIVRSGFSFKGEGLLFTDGNDDDGDEGNQTVVLENKEERGDFPFFIKGMDLGSRDSAALFFLVCFLSAAYGWVILGFLVTYSWVLGIVFISVVNDHLRRTTSFIGTVWDGSRLGLRRLSGFILMRWAVRDGMTQLLGLWFFGEIEDQYSFFKLFVRLKLMPFSVMLPWIRGFEKEISGFLFIWFLWDTLVSFIFAVDAWVAIVDTRRSGRDIVREGVYLLSTIFCGKLFAAVFQSVVEVYFMVAWLIFYFAARCRVASTEGRRFGRRELEGFIEGLR
uniref:Transmembrane protein n=1 Tax=Vitis vinifera TaxID=29760 RepID=F6HR35_VITVI